MQASALVRGKGGAYLEGDSLGPTVASIIIAAGVADAQGHAQHHTMFDDARLAQKLFEWVGAHLPQRLCVGREVRATQRCHVPPLMPYDV